MISFSVVESTNFLVNAEKSGKKSQKSELNYFFGSIFSLNTESN